MDLDAVAVELDLVNPALIQRSPGGIPHDPDERRNPARPLIPIPNSEVPGFYCSNADVQAFIEQEIADFNPYRCHLTAVELSQAARLRFSDFCCCDLEIEVH
jgi:hypothetical protein